MIALLNRTIYEIWPILLLNLLIYLLFRLFNLKNSKKKVRLFDEMYYISFIVYVFLLSSILSFGDLNLVSGSNFIPFKEILRYEFSSPLFYQNIIGNILLYMPLGFFIGRFLKFKKSMVPIFITTIISLTGECLQSFVGRTFDIDDVILNVTGGLIGFCLYRMCAKIYKSLPSVFQKDGLYNLFCIIIIILFVLYVLNVLGVVNVL